jgi:hypothetical protein
MIRTSHENNHGRLPESPTSLSLDVGVDTLASPYSDSTLYLT